MENKKIGLLTLHRSRNYGSVLQAFATQKVFEETGCEVEVIDYFPERYSTPGLLKRLKYKSNKFQRHKMLLSAAQCIQAISYIKRKYVFKRYVNKYLNISQTHYHNKSDFLKHPPQADIFCTGSDQIWSSFYNEGVDPLLYLSFVSNDHTRFSFSSSFGKESIDEKELEQIQPLLAAYRFLSVRENQAQNLLNKMGFSHVYHTLDPTLLFDNRWWSHYTSDTYRNKKYIVTYNLHHDKRVDRYTQNIRKKTGLPVFNISYNLHDIFRKGTLIWCPPVEDYLSLIKYAAFIVADSFHATAFSIIFNKKFAAIPPKTAPGRVKNILDVTGLPERLVSDVNDTHLFSSEIMYDKVNKRIQNEIKKTREYINMVLENIY